jgi:hypothetical protein
MNPMSLKEWVEKQGNIDGIIDYMVTESKVWRGVFRKDSPNPFFPIPTDEWWDWFYKYPRLSFAPRDWNKWRYRLLVLLSGREGGIKKLSECIKDSLIPLSKYQYTHRKLCKEFYDGEPIDKKG